MGDITINSLRSKNMVCSKTQPIQVKYIFLKIEKKKKLLCINHSFPFSFVPNSGVNFVPPYHSTTTCNNHKLNLIYKPREKGKPVESNQLEPPMKLPGVKARASAASVITLNPFQDTLLEVPAPGPVF